MPSRVYNTNPPSQTCFAACRLDHRVRMAYGEFALCGIRTYDPWRKRKTNEDRLPCQTTRLKGPASITFSLVIVDHAFSCLQHFVVPYIWVWVIAMRYQSSLNNIWRFCDYSYLLKDFDMTRQLQISTPQEFEVFNAFFRCMKSWALIRRWRSNNDIGSSSWSGVQRRSRIYKSSSMS
jgi:hypothetical protein